MLHRYILRATFWPLMAAIAALGFLALLTQSVATLDLIIDQRQSVLTYIEITALALPQLLALVLPLALFVAAIYAVNRLQNDSELVVCSAAGMDRWTVAKPVLQIAVAVLVANLAINLWGQPSSFRYMREKLYEVRGDLAAKLVRPGQFRSPVDGLTIYTKEIDRSGRLVDLLIEDGREEDRSVTYMAKTGVFTEIRGEPALVMTEGSIQSLEPNHSLSFLKFDSYPFVLSAVIDAPSSLFYKLSDRYLHELLFPNPNDLWDWRHRTDLLAEGHYRLSGPLYNLAFALIALASLLGGEFSRIGYAKRIAIGAVAALIIRLLGFSVQSLCADNAILNPIQYVIPLGASWFAAAVLFGRPLKQTRASRVSARAGAPA